MKSDSLESEQLDTIASGPGGSPWKAALCLCRSGTHNSHLQQHYKCAQEDFADNGSRSRDIAWLFPSRKKLSVHIQ